jgi:hypothetical protein
VVSFDRSHLKGEALRFSADINQSSLVKRPLNFLRHLILALEINRIIAMSDIYRIFIAPMENIAVAE